MGAGTIGGADDRSETPYRLGELVWRHRLRLRLTQRELADGSGLSVRAVRDIERGRVDRPQAASLGALASALGLSPAGRDQLSAAAQVPAEEVGKGARPGGPGWDGVGDATLGGGLRVGVLGPLVVVRDGQPVDCGPPQRRAILGLLSLRVNQVVPVEEVVDTVWGERPPRTCLSQLQSAVARLRRVLGAGLSTADALLRRERRGYRLRLREEDTDAAAFERYAVAGRRALDAGDPRSATESLGAALRLWRGSVLADAPERLRAHPTAHALACRRTDALLTYADAVAAIGSDGSDGDDALRWLRAGAAAEPWHEPLHARLVLALGRRGDRAGALRVFTAVRDRLDDELGVAPGEELRQAYEFLLREEPETVTVATAVAPAPLPTAPALLPAAPVGFVARIDELSTLDGIAADAGGGPAVAIVSGTAGVGKTALAVHWAHRVAGHFPDGQLYLNLRGFDQYAEPLPAADALLALLDALHVRPADVPDGDEARRTRYRRLLAGRRMVLVLDNARDAEQVRPLLPGFAGCAVIITSRERLTGLVATAGARPVPLAPLSTSESSALLARRLGADRVAAEPVAVNRIVGHCAGLPLALAVLAARALENPAFPLAVVAARLGSDNPLDGLGEPDPGTDLRTALWCSYRALPKPAATMFRLLGLRPGPDLSAADAARLAGVGVPEALTALCVLTRAHLAVEQVPGRFRLPPLVRAYAAELAAAPEREQERRAALRRLADV